MSGHTPWREVKHKRFLGLVCQACGAESDGRATGWRAPLGIEDDDSQVAVVLCPTCAADVDEHS